MTQHKVMVATRKSQIATPTTTEDSSASSSSLLERGAIRPSAVPNFTPLGAQADVDSDPNRPWAGAGAAGRIDSVELVKQSADADACMDG